MNLDKHQFVTDKSGATTAVLVPHEDYQRLLELLLEKSEAFDLRSQLTESLRELKLARAGKLRLIPAKEALDEL